MVVNKQVTLACPYRASELALLCALSRHYKGPKKFFFLILLTVAIVRDIIILEVASPDLYNATTTLGLLKIRVMSPYTII